MKNAFRRTMAILLVLMMIINIAPVTVLAENYEAPGTLNQSAGTNDGEQISSEVVSLASEQLDVTAKDAAQFLEVIQGAAKAPAAPKRLNNVRNTPAKVNVPAEDPNTTDNTVTDSADGYAAFDIAPAGEVEKTTAGYDVSVELTKDQQINMREELAIPENATATYSYTLYHILKDEDGNNTSEVETIIPQVTEKDGIITGFSFHTDTFSDFVMKYTVDFTYTDEETGEVKEFSFPGRGEYALTEVLEKLGITGEITEATLNIQEGTANEKALRLYQKDGAWYLASDEAFTDVYTLQVTVNGKKYTITVTDAKISDATSIEIDYLSQNEETHIVPNFGEGYYLVVYNGWGGGVTYYSPITGSSSQESITSLINENGQTKALSEIDLEVGSQYQFFIVRYSGSETPNRNTLNDAWYNTKTLEKVPNDGNYTLGGYRYTIPTGPTNGKYVFNAVKQPAYTVKTEFYGINGITNNESPETAPSVPTGYYVLAKVKDDEGYVAPLSSGILNFGTDVELQKIQELKIVQYTGNQPTYNSLKDIQKIDINGYVGKYQLKTIPSQDAAENYVYTIIFEKQPTYEVEIKFVDEHDNLVTEAPSGLPTNYTLYATQTKKNSNDEEVVYFHKIENVNLNQIDQLYPIASLKNSSDVPYDPSSPISVRLGDFGIAGNPGEYAGIPQYGIWKVNAEVVNGGTVGPYEFTITETEGKTTFVGKKAEPYRYTVSTTDNGDATLDESYKGYWYLLSELTKEDGTKYYYVKKLFDDSNNTDDNSSSDIPKTQGEIEAFYNAANYNNVTINNPAVDRYDPNTKNKVGIYQTGDSVENVLVYSATALQSYNDIISGQKYEDSDILNKYIVHETEGEGEGSLTLALLPDFKLVTEFKEYDETNTPNDKIPGDYKLLIKMIRNGNTYYALQNVPASGTTSDDSIVFYQFIPGGNGSPDRIDSTPYYYANNGKETLTTQVISYTGDISLSADLINHLVSNTVFYNENIVDGAEQRNDLTKDLYSTYSVVNKTTNVMTTTFVREKNDGVPHDLVVNFYKAKKANPTADDLVDNAELDATKDGAYYFVVRLYNQDKLVAYRIQSAAAEDVAKANSSGTFTSTIEANDTFTIVDDKGIDIPGSDNVHYDPTVYTSRVRLYKANTAGDLPKKLNEVDAKGIDTLDGYDFLYNNDWNKDSSLKTEAGGVITRTATHLGLYKAHDKIYQIRIVVEDGTKLTAADKLDLYVRAAHQTTNVDKYGETKETKPIITTTDSTESDVYTILIEDQTTDPITQKWTTLGETGNTLTGNESFEVYLAQDGTKLSAGYPIKLTNGESNTHYVVTYDTDTVDEDGIFLDKNVITDENATTITHFVHIKPVTYERAIDPYDVLGTGAEFGVVADTYIRCMHSETNFAVKHYDEQTIDGFDLAANKEEGTEAEGIPYYAGTYNKIKFTDNVKVNPDIYVPSSRPEPYVHNNNRDEDEDHIHQNAENYQVTVIPTSQSTINNFVDRLISKLVNSSRSYKDKSMISPVGDTVDTTSFPDGITIYVDASNMPFDNEHLIKIKKLENQTIVFNVPGETVNIRGASSGVLDVYHRNENGTLSEVEGAMGLGTNTGGNGGGEGNNPIENHFLNHIVYNVYEATRLTFTSGPAGLFLAPNANVEEVDGSGTGWVATAKTFKQTSSEWHFFRTQRRYHRDGTDIMLGAQKLMKHGTDEPTEPTKEQEFTFKLETLNIFDGEPTSGKWVDTQTVTNFGSAVAFDPIVYTIERAEGVHYYRITEVMPETDDRISGVTYDKDQYIVKVTVSANVTENRYLINPDTGIEVYRRSEPMPTTGYSYADLSFKVHHVEKSSNMDERITETEDTVTRYMIKEGCLGDLVPNGLDGIIFTNTEDEEAVGSLKLKKNVTVNGAAATTESDKALVAGTYTFTVASTTLDPQESRTVKVNISNTGAATLVDADTNTTIDASGYVTVANLKADSYTITETAPTNGTSLESTAVSPSTTESGNSVTNKVATVKVTAGDTATVPTATFTNNIDTGNLSLTKTVSGTTDSTTAFGFEITLTAPTGVTLASSYPAVHSGNNSITSVTVASGKVTGISLKHNETLTISGLPAGTNYTITEGTLPKGYSQGTASNMSGTIPANDATKTPRIQTVAASQVNTFAAAGAVTFKAEKTFTNGKLSTNPFSFKLTQVENAASTTQATTNVKLTAPQTKSTATTAGSGETSQMVTFDTISFTETDIVGSPYYFMIEETGIPNDLDANNISAGDHIKYDTSKHYFTVEVGLSGGELTVNKTASVAADGEDTAKFTNEQLGKLIVTKTFSGTAAGDLTPAEKAQIKFTIEGPTGFTKITNKTLNDTTKPAFAGTDGTYTLTLDNVPLGSYTVKEENDTIGNYVHTRSITVDNGTATTGASATAVLNADDTEKTVAITNTYEKYQLEITKAFTGDSIPADKKNLITFSITGSSLTGETSKTWAQIDAMTDDKWILTTAANNVQPGVKYTVTETNADIGGYTRTTTIATTPAGTATTTETTTNTTIELSDTNKTGTISFTNNYTEQAGSLKLKKNVTVNGAAATTESDKALVAGTYTFTVASTTLDPQESRTVKVNISNTGAATLVDADTNTTIDASGYVTVANLKADSYTITETAPTNGTSLESTAVNPSTTESGNSVTNKVATVKVTAGETANVPTATFTNNIDTGNLSLTKTVSGTTDSTTAFGFEITLTAPTGVTLASSYPAVHSGNNGITSVTVASGKVTGISLKHNETLTISGLPAGTGYAISETTSPDVYHLDSSASNRLSGSIPGRAADETVQTAEAQAVNAYAAAGDVIFQAAKTFTNGKLSTKPFSFKLTQVESDTSTTAVTTKLTAPQTKSTATAAGSGETSQTVTFDTISFTKTDIAGSPYYFMIEETGIPNDLDANNISAGDHIKYDTSKHYFTVTVAAGASGLNINVVPKDATDVNKTAKFTNEQLGKLIVTKTFSGTAAGDLTPAEKAQIKFTIEGPTGFTKITEKTLNDTTKPAFAMGTDGTYTLTLDNVPLGSYTVKEENDTIGNYVHTRSITVDNGTATTDASATAVLNADDTEKTVAITNTYEKYQLEITKAFTGDSIPADKKNLITFSITGGSLKGETSKTWAQIDAMTDDKWILTTAANNVQPGVKYTVTETNADIGGYTRTTTIATTPAGTATTTETTTNTTIELSGTNKTGTISFTNNYTEQAGSLKLKKTVTVNGAGATTESDKALVAGTYTFTVASTTLDPQESRTVKVNISNTGAATLVDADTNTTIDASGYVTVANLKADSYTITETAPTNGTSLESTAVSPSTTESGNSVTNKVATVKVTAGDTATVPTATFTNNIDIGSLEVTKSVTSNTASDKSLKFQFKVELGDKTITGTYGDLSFTDGVAEFELKDGEKKTATDLPAGIDYTVTETSVDGFATTSTGDTGKIVKATTRKAAFVNTRAEGDLTVSKIVDSDLANDLIRNFQFQVELGDKTLTGKYGGMQFNSGIATFSLTNGQSVSASGLPKGITYKVTETEESGFTATWTGETGTIGDTAAVATCTNTRNTGDLKVTKSVVSSTGSDHDKEFAFKVTLTDGSEINGTYGDMTFANGVAEFSLKDGEEATASGLPVGIHYNVQEENYATEYDTTRSGQDGQIAEGEQTAAYVNTRREGDLSVEKKLEGTDGDPERAFEIKVTLGDKTLSGTYGEMTFTDGVAVLSLKGGEKKTATGLPTNISYTVEETKEVLYTLASSSDLNGTIAEGQEKAAKLVNRYEKPDKPVFEKKIQDTNDTTGETSGWQDSADYDIGDSVPYRLTAILSKDVTSYWQYHVTFHDKMEKSLTFEKIERVEVNGEALPESGYSLKKTSDQEFSLTVTFNDGKSQITDTALNSGKVEVFFTAQLNENAVLGSKGNVNTAYLEYSSNPDLVDDGKGGKKQSEETEKTEEDFVICFTYETDITKVDPEGKALSGAEFTLEKVLKDGTKKTVKSVTATDGTKFSFTGLDDGEYILTETKVPEGFIGIEPVTIKVTATHDAKWEDLSKRESVLTSLTGDTGTGELALLSAGEKLDKLTGNLKNAREEGTTQAAIRKVWKDEGNRDGLRPKSLQVELLADGVKTGTRVALSDLNNWTAMVKDLPAKSAGKEITYTWSEPAVEGYTLTGTAGEGILTTLTNTHEAEKTKVSVRKAWEGGKQHPDSVKVQLYADGKAVGETVTLSEANGWKHTWTELVKNKNQAGVISAVRYTVGETEIPEGYTARITGNADTGFVITNTAAKGKLVIEKAFSIQEPEPEPEPDDRTTDIEVVKIWDDFENRDGNRPESITVHLYAGGEEVRSGQLTAANGWRKTFGGLPKFVNGTPIRYSVKEDPVPWYIPEYNHFTITNRYQPETTSVSVRKIWNDEDNKLGTRPLSIVMTLNNGMSVILKEENGWMASISGLPVMVNGKPAEYTWKEQKVLGYELESVITEGSVTTFTNTLWKRPDKPTEGKKPKNAGDTWYIFEEYDTPLGVDVVINHVGDCFD